MENHVEFIEDKLVIKELPLSQVEMDHNQPRRNTEKDVSMTKLKRSIEKYGIQEPISVHEYEQNHFLIINGHRRYACAKELDMSIVPCRIYRNLTRGELEFLRFEIQNNRKAWAPLERAESINRIRQGCRLKNDGEVATMINYSETMVSASRKLRDLNIQYLGMMKDYGLDTQAFQHEFVRLDGKFRKIKDLETDEMVKILFEKVRSGVISNAKDFRLLGRVFMRATAHEEQLYEFLKEPDMTVGELVRKTDLTKVLMLAEELRDVLSEKIKKEASLSQKEKKFLPELARLMNEAIKF